MSLCSYKGVSFRLAPHFWQRPNQPSWSFKLWNQEQLYVKLTYQSLCAICYWNWHALTMKAKSTIDHSFGHLPVSFWALPSFYLYVMQSPYFLSNPVPLYPYPSLSPSISYHSILPYYSLLFLIYSHCCCVNLLNCSRCLELAFYISLISYSSLCLMQIFSWKNLVPCLCTSSFFLGKLFFFLGHCMILKAAVLLYMANRKNVLPNRVTACHVRKINDINQQFFIGRMQECHQVPSLA